MNDFTRLVQLELEVIGRRIRGLAMISRGIVPNLVISQKVVDHIVQVARTFIQDETGESMVGFVRLGEDPEEMPTIYILDTIAPDEEATVRLTHTFQQGDDLQDEIIWWLQENWRLCRDKQIDAASKPLESRWDTPLRYLGDWHKQPGYMIQPSGGDLLTALAWLDDPENQMDYLLVPIVTLGHPDTTMEDGAQVNYFTVLMDDETRMRVDWWYIHRDVRVFQPITPVIRPESEFPALAAYPWHLLRPVRLEDEVALMQEDGLFVEPIVWQADEDIPMELCFFVARPGAASVLLLTTEHNYPYQPPRAYVAPFQRFDPNDDFYAIFEQFWADAEPVDQPEGWIWHENLSLLAYIHAVEIHLGLRPMPAPPSPPPAAEAASSVSIAVEVEPDGPPPKAVPPAPKVEPVDAPAPDETPAADRDAANTDEKEEETS